MLTGQIVEEMTKIRETFMRPQVIIDTDKNEIVEVREVWAHQFAEDIYICYEQMLARSLEMDRLIQPH